MHVRASWITNHSTFSTQPQHHPRRQPSEGRTQARAALSQRSKSARRRPARTPPRPAGSGPSSPSSSPPPPPPLPRPCPPCPRRRRGDGWTEETWSVGIRCRPSAGCGTSTGRRTSSAHSWTPTLVSKPHVSEGGLLWLGMQGAEDGPTDVKKWMGARVGFDAVCAGRIV